MIFSNQGRSKRQKKKKLHGIKYPKRNLDQKANHLKPHTWSLFFILDFLAENLKATKNK